ncbi:MAG: 50S ribosomal protein L18 [Acidobacteria bacterium]|nr:50S ribosomal protein L18 [Acidobacteriota bacterium]MCB9399635.1 50S ribosomal protein L18 [Acidobacteriota bacterium]
MKLKKDERRIRIHQRVRKIVKGTADVPRLAVFRSNKQIYVQAIDDMTGNTLAAASTVEKEFRSAGKAGSNIDAATQVGNHIAKRLLEKGISKAVFDRGGYLYHGRVKAVAEGARSAGLTI